METERLKQFCTIVESGSYTQAAEILGISMSGLSKSIKILQIELGLELLQQKGRGIQTTLEGEKVYRMAFSLLDQVRELHTLKNIKAHKPYRVGGLEVFTHSLLPKYLLREVSDHPLHLVELAPGDLENAILKGLLDLGITYFPFPQEGIEYLKIKQIELKAYIDEKVEPRAFEELDFILPLSVESPDVTDLFDRDGWPDLTTPRKWKVKTNRLSTALSMMKNTPYAIFIPDFFVTDLPLKEIPLPKKVGPVYRDIFLVKPRKSKEENIHKVLAKIIRKYC